MAVFRTHFTTRLATVSETNIAEPEIDNDGDHGDCPYMKDKCLKNISSQISNCTFYETNNIKISISSFSAQTTEIVFRGSSMQYSGSSMQYSLPFAYIFA